MILHSIKLQDFKSYGEPQTVDLSTTDAVSISGPNGAGKSTIIEALTFALYGRSTATERKELGNDAIIRDGEDEAFASVTFEKDGQIYTVERTARRKGTGTAALLSGSKTLQAGAANVSKRIESILGMDYETFVSSTIIRQDEMDRITALRPGERKEILSKIFGLELYEKLKKRTHERLITTKAEIEAAEQLRERLSDTILGEKRVLTELQEAKTAGKKAETAISKNRLALELVEDQIKGALAKKSEYDVKRTHLDAVLREISDAGSTLEDTSAEVESAKEAEKTLTVLVEQIDKGKDLQTERDKAAKLRDEVNRSAIIHEEKAQRIREQISEEQEHYAVVKSSKNAECPVCKRALDEEHRKRVLAEYETKLSELKVQYEKSHSKYLAEQGRLEKQIEPRLDELEKQLKELQTLEVRKAKLESIVSRLPKLSKTLTELNSKITSAKRRRKELESDLRALEETVKEYEALQSKRRELSEALADFREQKASSESSIKHLNELLKEINQAKAELKRLEGRSSEQARAVHIYGILEDAFGKDGIPTAILKDLVPEVEEESSKILRELSNGGMSINFRFGRTTRGGIQTDELVTEAENSTGVHPVTRFSGGERMRINLALRLGISEVIARRSGYKGKIETLIIDEGFSALDEEGRQAAIEILRQLRERFEKIIVISHLEDIKDAFDTKLIISKSARAQSTVELA